MRLNDWLPVLSRWLAQSGLLKGLRMRRNTWLLVILIVAVLLILFERYGPKSELPPHEKTVTPGGARNYLFCAWNVENLFDDQDDGRKTAGDNVYDPWLAKNPDILKLKLQKLTEALLGLNDGKGPDILALVEVESVRAAELLQEALNAQLSDESLHYKKPLMKEISGLRHIAPAILTRLPVVRDKTRAHGNRLRILEGHLTVDDHDLIVFATHWSSRVRESGEEGRERYAEKIYGACNAIYQTNPDADILICGDFNDTPDDESVTEHLHAVGDIQKVRASTGKLTLFNLSATKDPNEGFGTHFYNGKWFLFDQVVIAPGLLDDKGWSCDVSTLRTVNTLTQPQDRRHRPWRFGSPKEHGPRGYSDHFPVTVRLTVHGS